MSIQGHYGNEHKRSEQDKNEEMLQREQENTR